MRLANVMGVDDAPFDRAHRGDVAIVGAVFSDRRLDGVLTSRVRRDGANSTRRVAAMLRSSPFDEHVGGILLDGIALGGFNVVDLEELHARTGRPVLAIARRRPDLVSIRRALLAVPGGARKWRLIEKAGPMEPVEGLWVQRAGVDRAGAARAIRSLRLVGKLPEPLRVAHLIAGALARGVSRGAA